MPVLLIQRKLSDASRRVRLVADRAVFGRSDDCDLTLRHNSVSRRHFQVQLLGNVWYIEDLGSSAGTYVNRKKVNGRQALGEGDIVAVGEVRITLLELEDQKQRSKVRGRKATRRVTLPSDGKASAKSDRQEAAPKPEVDSAMERRRRRTTMSFIFGDLNYSEDDLSSVDDFMQDLDGYLGGDQQADPTLETVDSDDIEIELGPDLTENDSRPPT